MKLSITLAPLLLSFAATPTFASLFGGNQQVLEDKPTVPGDNPLVFCQDTADYTLTIDYVDLSPNPPKAGQTLSIQAKGNFTEKILQGAFVNLQVKYGLIRLINQKTDLCEQMKNIDEECPLYGEKVITKDVDLPKEIPPGHYTVLADVFTKDSERITCLEASIQFGGK
ncbi:hypothetical protein P7C71_g1123, partial [Lecanoromycetidae sp. Uapishka_2]